MPVLSAECKYSTFPTEGSVALLNNTNSGWVPRFGKLSSAKSKKDTRKQFLSFNSTSVALTTEGFFFFFWWKLLKKKSFSFHVSQPTEGMEKIKAECIESAFWPRRYTDLSIAVPALLDPSMFTLSLGIRKEPMVGRAVSMLRFLLYIFLGILGYFLDRRAALCKLWYKIWCW